MCAVITYIMSAENIYGAHLKLTLSKMSWNKNVVVENFVFKNVIFCHDKIDTTFRWEP